MSFNLLQKQLKIIKFRAAHKYHYLSYTDRGLILKIKLGKRTFGRKEHETINNFYTVTTANPQGK